MAMSDTTAMSEGLRFSRPNDSEKARMKMIQVDLVMVYLQRRNELFASKRKIDISRSKFSFTPFRVKHRFRLRQTMQC